MSIEERLEAITQTLELTARMQQQRERDLAASEDRREQELAAVKVRTGQELAAAKERTKRLEDQLVVQAELVARFERRVDDWIESAETRLARLEVLSTAVLERIDRFIAGQERNGRENGGRN